MRLSSTGAKALGLGRSGTAPLKLGLGGGGKESTLEKEMVKQLEETLKAKDAELDALKNEVLALNKVSDENARLRDLLQRSEKLRVEQLASFQTKLRAAMDAHRDAVAPLLEETTSFKKKDRRGSQHAMVHKAFKDTSSAVVRTDEGADAQ